MTRRMGRSPATLDRNAAQLGQPLGRSEAGDKFFSEWAALQEAYALTPEGLERAALAFQLMLYEDHFHRVAY